MGMKGGTLVCLKQPIPEKRLVLFVLGDGEVRERGERSSNWAGVGARGVERTSGDRREGSKKRECIFGVFMGDAECGR